MLTVNHLKHPLHVHYKDGRIFPFLTFLRVFNCANTSAKNGWKMLTYCLTLVWCTKPWCFIDPPSTPTTGGLRRSAIMASKDVFWGTCWKDWCEESPPFVFWKQHLQPLVFCTFPIKNIQTCTHNSNEKVTNANGTVSQESSFRVCQLLNLYSQQR